MAEKIRVVHYINQFFAQEGGEEMADLPLQLRRGPVGPGLAFQKALGEEYEIAATLVCGDNYFSDHGEEVLAEIEEHLRRLTPKLVLAGPAFNAGRYGPACGAVCALAEETLGIAAVTGMYEENPGVELFRGHCYIVGTRGTAAGMRQAAAAMAGLAKKLVKGEEQPDPQKDQYFRRGFRKNVFVEKTGARRAWEMLEAKAGGLSYHTELELPAFETVMPAPAVQDLSHCRLGLVTDAGLTDKENTYRLESARATKYLELDISGMERLDASLFSSVHGGYDTREANQDPNVIVPLDIVRKMVRDGEIGSLLETVYSTTGNGTSLQNSQEFGREIAEKLQSQRVDAVLLTST